MRVAITNIVLPLFLGMGLCSLATLAEAPTANPAAGAISTSEKSASVQRHVPAKDINNLSVAHMGYHAPWTYQHEQQWQGLLVRYTEDLLQHLDSPYQESFYSSYPRMIAELKAGKIDAITAFKTHENPLPEDNTSLCTEPVAEGLVWGVYALKSRGINPVDDLQNLKEYRLSLARSTQRNPMPVFDRENITQHIAPDNMYKMIKSGRSDLVATTRALVSHWQQQYGDQFVELYKLGEYSAHVCLSTKSLGRDKAEELKVAIEAGPKVPAIKLASF